MTSRSRIAIDDQLPVSENEEIQVDLLPATTPPTTTNLARQARRAGMGVRSEARRGQGHRARLAGALAQGQGRGDNSVRIEADTAPARTAPLRAGARTCLLSRRSLSCWSPFHRNRLPPMELCVHQHRRIDAAHRPPSVQNQRQSAPHMELPCGVKREDADAVCALSVTFGIPKRGLLLPGGSISRTSSPAWAIQPSDSALISAISRSSARDLC